MVAKKKTASRNTPARKKTATKKSAKKKVVKRKAVKKMPSPQRKAPATPPATPRSSSGGGEAGLRVRMYRVGFGDFFLVTIPVASGPPKHILIDCGVHSKDTGSIAAAVDHMAEETGGEFALIIVTHRHADHVTGFSRCKDVFSKFKVERIWMSWYEDPKDRNALALQAKIAAVASQVQQALAARADKCSDYFKMVANITEAMSATGGQQNPAAFEVLRSFPGDPPIDYYKAGDTPTLPPSLVAAGLAAKVLGPPTDRAMIASVHKASEEYIVSEVVTETGPIKPFAAAFRVQPGDYSSTLFERLPRSLIEGRVAYVQPDMLAARADMANNMINNQSLVTLFTFRNKTLLFAGDAQWGNWANFLFGSLTSTTLTQEASAILNNLDFYKVGHHGSTNATPKDALAAIREGCIAMCSTAIGAYVRVPRDELITAIDERTHNHLARSDQIAAGNFGKDPNAGELPQDIFNGITVDTASGKCGFIDYVV